MPPEAPSQRPSYIDCYFSCFRSPFGTKISKFLTPRDPQNQAFSLRGSSFLRFSRFCVRRPSWTPLGGHLGPIWGPLGASWGPLGGHLGAQNRRLQKAPPPLLRYMRQSALQTPQGPPKRPPRGPQEAPRRPPRGPQRPQMRPPKPSTSVPQSFRRYL